MLSALLPAAAPSKVRVALEKRGVAPRKEGARTWEHVTMEAESHKELSVVTLS